MVPHVRHKVPTRDVSPVPGGGKIILQVQVGFVPSELPVTDRPGLSRLGEENRSEREKES